MNVKWTAALLAAAGLGGLIVWRLVTAEQAAGGAARRGGPRATPVLAEPVVRAVLRDEREFTGSLLPRARFEVSSKVPGRVLRILAQLGDAVTNGALVARLDSDEYEQGVEQARAEWEVSRATLQEARIAIESADRDFRRVRALREQRIAAEAEREEAESRLRAAEAKGRVAEAQVRQREAALRSAEVRLDYTQIRAVWEGGNGRARLVSERFVDEGATLRANDPILTVVDTETVLAVIHVIERDYARIRPGQTVEIRTDAHPDRVFEGRVARVSPVLREASRQARVEIEAPNGEGALAPGLFVRVRVRFEEHVEARAVPQAALVRRGGEPGVFVIEAESRAARFVKVRTGIEDGRLVEILEPDLAGNVVTLGQHLLEDGAAITMPGLSPEKGRP